MTFSADGSAALLDADEVAALVLKLIQDPGQADLREALIHDLRARLEQDAVFRAEFAAAIFG